MARKPTGFAQFGPDRDLIGLTFGKLRIVALVPEKGKKGQTLFECVCACGKTTKVCRSYLVIGRTRSCGCLRGAKKGDGIEGLPPYRTHAVSDTKVYRKWRSMINRCTNKKSQFFRYYGGKGVNVCDRWLHSFEAFYADMGPPPSGMSIDRIDGEGDYSPENCRWATPTEQMNNRGSYNRRVEIGGVTRTVAEWCALTGINYQTAQHRIRRGWSYERVFSVPPDVRRRKKGTALRPS